jgi:hypothetical protein
MAALLAGPRPSSPDRRPHAVFFDFKAAYDSVDRDMLFDRLEATSALSSSQIDLLRFLYGNLRVAVGRGEMTTSRGVPQGLTSSPILFDLYVEPVLEAL